MNPEYFLEYQIKQLVENKKLIITISLVISIHIAIAYGILGIFTISNVKTSNAQVIDSYLFAESTGSSAANMDLRQDFAEQTEDTQQIDRTTIERDPRTHQTEKNKLHINSELELSNPDSTHVDISIQKEEHNKNLQDKKQNSEPIKKQKSFQKKEHSATSTSQTQSGTENTNTIDTKNMSKPGGGSSSPPSSDAAYLNNPHPVYPRISKRLGEQGKVILSVLIDIDGTARNVQIKQTSGFQRLDEVAVETVKKWRYVPGKISGTPQSMLFNIPINFVLE